MPQSHQATLQRHLFWATIWLAGSLLAGLVLGRLEIDRLRSAFDADAQRLHSTISQKLSANDALLAQLAQAPSREARSRIESRMAQTHPCVVSLVKRESGASWGDESLRTAEAASSKAGHAALASVQPAKARYALVLAAEPTSFALQIDLKAMLPWQDWPMPNAASSVRLSVDHGGQPLVQQPGAPRLDAVAGLTESGELPRGWPLVFAQAADSLSQPFVVRVERLLVWADLPWSLMLNFALLWALLLLAARALLRQRHDRLRARELMQLGKVGRLNTLAELAAGVANELSVPLQAAHHNLQAAQSGLTQAIPENPAALSHVQLAGNAIDQMARAVGRLRHVAQRPEQTDRLERLSLQVAVRHALDVMQPELRRLGVVPRVELQGAEFTVLAEHGALQQILHNLLLNALQALEVVAPPDRALILALTMDAGMGRLMIQDTGPGMSNSVVSHIFEPFFTTRTDGLGLGLSLCESLASGMGGTLTAYNRVPRGAEFALSLRLAG